MTFPHKPEYLVCDVNRMNIDSNFQVRRSYVICTYKKGFHGYTLKQS